METVIKTTLKNLVTSELSLALLLQFKLKSGKSIKRIAKIAQHVQSEIEQFNQTKEKVCTNHEGKLEEDAQYGSRYKFPSKELEKQANGELQDLLNSEVLIPGHQFTYFELRTVKDDFNESDEDAIPTGFTGQMVKDLVWLIKD